MESPDLCQQVLCPAAGGCLPTPFLSFLNYLYDREDEEVCPCVERWSTSWTWNLKGSYYREDSRSWRKLFWAHDHVHARQVLYAWTTFHPHEWSTAVSYNWHNTLWHGHVWSPADHTHPLVNHRSSTWGLPAKLVKGGGNTKKKKKALALTAPFTFRSFHSEVLFSQGFAVPWTCPVTKG